MSISNGIRCLVFSFLFFLSFSTSVQATWSSDPSINTSVDINSKRQIPIKVISDGNKGIYIMYIDFVNNGGIYIQRLDEQGNKIWMDGGVLIGKLSGFVNIRFRLSMVESSENNIILVWEEVRSNINRIIAQKINPDGEFLWGEGGLLVSQSSTLDAFSPQAVSDDSGGIVVSWLYDTSLGLSQVKAQQVSNDGLLKWGTDGISLTGFRNRERTVRVAEDTEGGAYLLYRGNSDQILLIQHINASGGIVWPNEGIVVSSFSHQGLTGYGFVPDGSGGVYLQWTNSTDISHEGRYQRISNDGSFLWGSEGLVYPFNDGPITSDLEGNLYVMSTPDISSGNTDIDLHKFNSEGVPQWDGEAVHVVQKPGTQPLDSFVLDDSNGLVVMWTDRGETNNTAQSDIYAQRIDRSTGQTLWPIEGVVVSNAFGAQLNSVVDQVDEASLVTAWEDNRNGVGTNDIYAQKINLDGTLGDAPSPTPTQTPTPTFTPTPTPNKHFELPISYADRLNSTLEQFKSTFWSKLNAGFDHELEKGIFTSFLGIVYRQKDGDIIGVKTCTPQEKCYDSHNGLDFSRTNGMNAYSVANGNVLYVSSKNTDDQCIEETVYGCVALVEYDHPNQEGESLVGLYAHLSKIDVAAGDLITAATKIGDMGKTGCKDCGVHLHFGVLKEVGISSLITKQKTLSSRMTKKDWQSLLADLPDEDGKKNEQDLGGNSAKASCTYPAPNGIRFAFIDPSGWKGQEIDPWSLPIDFSKKVSGCGINSSYLWKHDIGTSLN